VFETTLFAGWGDMDFNSHMRNTAYLDKSADTRMRFFAEHGFPISEFAAAKFGPVIQRDELEYFKEVGLMESLRVTLALAGLAEDGSRFVLRNEFHRGDGKLAARVTSTGGWLDHAARRLVAPPTALRDLLATLQRTTDYRELPSSAK
jgi:acyl-CoA thioester hydrolase